MNDTNEKKKTRFNTKDVFKYDGIRNSYYYYQYQRNQNGDWEETDGGPIDEPSVLMEFSIKEYGRMTMIYDFDTDGSPCESRWLEEYLIDPVTWYKINIKHDEKALEMCEVFERYLPEDKGESSTKKILSDSIRELKKDLKELEELEPGILHNLQSEWKKMQPVGLEPEILHEFQSNWEVIQKKSEKEGLE